MDTCGILPIVLPSLYAAKNELETVSCIEDPSCIGYVSIMTIGILYVLYRFLTRGMSKKGRHEALWNFLFRKTKKN
ncbi:MAG: hypothetical protein CMO17_03190 [Thaumarchaeota archaeon]|jgi:hypothetical protein|nr:hypothetical protein [Nitrososphaerota archaeon]|tara:strand:- start:12 stop:239 length:228 start_codon:yes stop_codon:yes gene_type:complete